MSLEKYINIGYDQPRIPGSDKVYKYKTDMTTLKEYSQHDFMDALEYIGFFKN